MNVTDYNIMKKMSLMKNICIVKTGSTFSATRADFNDFEDWIISRLDLTQSSPFTVNVQAGESLPDLRACDGIILTGSHSMVTDEDVWSQKTAQWLRDVVHQKIPLLAICYGHQLLAKSLGGVSDYHPNGMEIGTVEIKLTEDIQDDPLFCELPDRLFAHTIHSQTVLELPCCAVKLAYNSHDENHAFRIGKCAWGVQFHPEFTRAIMNAYIEEVAKTEKFDVEQKQKLLEQLQETEESNALLKKFESLVGQY
ncbi:MAG: glutamine amidotransferase [Sulfuricurvum sp.]|uniref:glutamine amidotransferase n=1 Tax=Sulfuricurvum sp. TaxID=2025608 RepID=UPI002618369E|nr:glutamine amidotransferase [Sulfuricurvum sp.]MDD2368659.1 glutamine amidotransferase [Sulfuricurvum sp.]MDD2949411.1 glutamine amidotransferase [Sulfuricurvum sp.]MDD5117166.1 glutamine amidotransferase [Sulfuricurvum sp.]